MLLKQWVYYTILVGVFSVTASAWAVERYTVQPLPFGGLLNDQGQIAGTQTVLDDNGNPKGEHAVLWDKGIITDLGALGVDRYGTSHSKAVAINERGQVAGDSTIYDIYGNILGTHAFLWSQSQMQDLGALDTDANGKSDSWVAALNLHGQVVGRSTIYNLNGTTQEQHAFMWTDGNMLDLAPAGVEFADQTGVHSSAAIDINDNSQVLLSSRVYYPAIRFTPPYYEDSIRFESERPLVWTDGSLQQLDSVTFPDIYSGTSVFVRFGEALTINNEGFVLGKIRSNFFPPSRVRDQALIWHPDASAQLLSPIPADGIRLYSVRQYFFDAKINAVGQIVGIYTYGETRYTSSIPAILETNGGAFKRVQAFCNNTTFFGNNTTLVMNAVSIDINDSGDVVFSSYCKLFGGGYAEPTHGYLYRDGIATDLNTLIPENADMILTGASAINNAGQILASGNKGYVLLTPIPNTKPATCDANNDGKIDTTDLVIIHAANRTTNPAYDLDGDGWVSVRDVRKCVTQCTALHCEP